MKIRQESYGSLNSHVNQIFKLSVINIHVDHMLEAGLQKKKKKKKKKKKEFLPTDPVSYFGWNLKQTGFVFALVNQNAELCY